MEIKEKIAELERQLNELKASLKEEAKDNQPITERVKTFEDALDVLGKGHPFVKQWWDYINTDYDVDIPTKDNADLIAYYKLRIITAALNEGWEPKFKKDESRYYPWYRIFTEKDYDNLSEEEKQGLLKFGGNAYYSVAASLLRVDSGYNVSVVNVGFGSHLYFKTDKLARYAGRQFADLYADYLLIKNS